MKKNDLCDCCDGEIEEVVVGDIGEYCSDGCLEEMEADSILDKYWDD